MNVIRTFGRHDVIVLLCLIDRIGRWRDCLVLDHPLDRGGSEMKSRSRQDLRDLAFAERRAQRLESLNDIADEVPELVDRLSELDQHGRADLVDFLQPRSYGCWFNEEGLGGLGKRPYPCSFEFEDGHAFGRGVVRSAVWIDPGHASILDSESFAKELNLLLEPVILGGKTNASVDAIGGPSAGVGDGVVGHGDDAEDRRADGIGPSRGQRNVRERLVAHW